MQVDYDVVVIGGGVHGLATLWHLGRLGAGRCALVERFHVGHAHGSSHGRTRITRSVYEDERWVRLMRVAREEDWPRLERDAQARKAARKEEQRRKAEEKRRKREERRREKDGEDEGS